VPVQYRLSALAVVGQVGGLGSRPIPRVERPQYRFQPGIAQIQRGQSIVRCYPVGSHWDILATILASPTFAAYILPL
jgi:hypothetical protein